MESDNLIYSWAIIMIVYPPRLSIYRQFDYKEIEKPKSF